MAVAFVLTSAAYAYGQRPAKEGRSAHAMRQNAIAVLDSAVEELGAVEDIEARVTLAADILKLLGGAKPARCRQMLDATFDELMKLKGAKGPQSDPRRATPDALLRRLIQAAASFDRKLASAYIAKYTGEGQAQRSEPATPAHSPAEQADLRMVLALQLIETDPALAVRVAGSAVAVAVTVRTLEFLGTLRKRDAVLADGFFAAALQSVRARRVNDVNELLLLYTYVFSPTRVLWLTSQGIVLRQIPAYQRVAQDYPVDVRLAQQFLQASAQILLADPPQRLVTPGTGAAGDLYFINLIKPLAATYASGLSGPLSERAGLLVSYLQPEQYSRLQSDVERLGKAQEAAGQGAVGGGSGFESMLSRAEAMPPSPKRDHLYYTAAMAAVREKQYDAAVEIVGQVSAESRDKAREFIGFSIARQSVSARQFERAEQWAERDADLPRRAHTFALIADALLEDDGKDYARAARLLNEVERLASKAEATRERISLLLRAAEVYARFDGPRASTILRQALKAANGEERFTGEGKITRLLDVGDFGFVYELFNDQLSLAGVLARLGASDFYGTLSDVRELQDRALRLRAVVSLCGGVLGGERPSRPAGTAEGGRAAL